MQKLMTMLIAGEADARVEVWLERGSAHGLPSFHAISFRGPAQLQRSSAQFRADEGMSAGARRLCGELCQRMGWLPA